MNKSVLVLKLQAWGYLIATLVVLAGSVYAIILELSGEALLPFPTSLLCSLWLLFFGLFCLYSARERNRKAKVLAAGEVIDEEEEEILIDEDDEP